MSDTLIDLIQAVSSSKAKPAVQKPASQTSTNPDAPGSPLSAQGYDPLKTEATTWFPEIPAELLSGSYSTDWPSRPGGALEVVSVTQIRGDKSGSPIPIAVRTYPVRGTVV